MLYMPVRARYDAVILADKVSMSRRSLRNEDE
jgi:hypothetical protein